MFKSGSKWFSKDRTATLPKPLLNPSFSPFWEKEDSTGITRIKEQLCDKHQLHAWMSNRGLYDSYWFICVKCGAAYRISVEDFVTNFTREN